LRIAPSSCLLLPSARPPLLPLLSLHAALPLLDRCRPGHHRVGSAEVDAVLKAVDLITAMLNDLSARIAGKPGTPLRDDRIAQRRDRKGTRLNSSHSQNSYAAFCLKKKTKTPTH